KKVLKFLGAFFALILAVVIVFGIMDCMYYSHYKNSSAIYDVSAKEETAEITLMSANVRTWSPTDTGKKSWFYRAPLMLQTLANAQPDIIGFQEMTWLHRQFLDRRLKGYDSVIEYRDKSFLAEGCPIYYNVNKFDLADKGSFWLSETPDVMSKGWNAAHYRICSYVILTQKADGKQLVVFNTHLDNVSEEARINGIRLVLQKIEQFGGMPSIIMGDFNAEEDSATYAAATALFNDAKYQTTVTDAGMTYHGYGKDTSYGNLDYFMISKTGIDVESYKVLRDTYDGAYPSDHYPIRLVMTLQ
ncbi:MAG: endonuclease/exonuclease/phosphatase family protein, partial [Clostridia bacterium]|nr:endonuclease/exonuclease/phosphatase family protein [Clostridia bacterium]